MSSFIVKYCCIWGVNLDERFNVSKEKDFIPGTVMDLLLGDFGQKESERQRLETSIDRLAQEVKQVFDQCVKYIFG